MAIAAVISLSSNEMPCAFQQPQFKTPPLPTAATKETKKSLGTFRDELLGIRREDRIRRNKKGSKFVYASSSSSTLALYQSKNTSALVHFFTFDWGLCTHSCWVEEGESAFFFPLRGWFLAKILPPETGTTIYLEEKKTRPCDGMVEICIANCQQKRENLERTTSEEQYRTPFHALGKQKGDG